MLIAGRKAAGILAELHTGPTGLAIVAGIGVNLNLRLDELPEELRDKATSILAATDQLVDRAAFAARLLSELQKRYEQFCAGGFAAMRADWDRLSCLNGRRVNISGAGVVQNGTVAGMCDDGTLRLVSDDGCEMRVVAGDVTVLDGYGSEALR